MAGPRSLPRGLRRAPRPRRRTLAAALLLVSVVAFGAIAVLAVAPRPVQLDNAGLAGEPGTIPPSAPAGAAAEAEPGQSSAPDPLRAGDALVTPDPTERPATGPMPSGSDTDPSATGTLPSAGAARVRTGMTAHYMWQSLADTIRDVNLLRDAGMRYTRFDFSWANSAPAKGATQYFDKLDAVLDAVIDRGLTYTITVLETPGWANGGHGKMAPPTNPQDYADFMGVLARHEAARPNMVWEIWNEPNLAAFWTSGPSPRAYTAMLKATYRAIKANDPDATVLVGGIAFNDLAYFEDIYSNGGGDSFDGVAIHPYAIARSPWDTSSARYTFKGSVPQFTQSLERHGQGHKPLYVTEMGWSTRDVSDSTRATYLKDATAIARTWTNVPGMAVYTIRQSQFATFGLMTTSYEPTRSWNAYASVQE